MLKPEYFDNKEDRLLEIYRELEEFILKDIAGRLLTARELSGTADRLIYKLWEFFIHNMTNWLIDFGSRTRDIINSVKKMICRHRQIVNHNKILSVGRI